MKIKTSLTNSPTWRNMYTQVSLPEELIQLEKLAHNLWWIWSYDATDLFFKLDPELWNEVEENPVIFLQKLSYDRIQEVLKDAELMALAKKVLKNFDKYMSEPFDSSKPSVAYFSMEYGFTHILKIYSGGLGVLAGDYLKEASDSHVDLVGVGSYTATDILRKAFLPTDSR